MGAIPSLIQDSLLFTPNMEDPIEVVEEAKDLGVIIDHQMSFKAQRAKAQSKASQKAGWVLRTFSTRALGPLRTLWKALVQPHLDYSSQLWVRGEP